MKQDDENPTGAMILEGRYANGFQIGHNAFEFLLDFGQLSLDDPQVQFHTRIITGPAYAKVLSGILRESIDRYEQTFGVIPNVEE